MIGSIRRLEYGTPQMTPPSGESLGGVAIALTGTVCRYHAGSTSARGRACGHWQASCHEQPAPGDCYGVNHELSCHPGGYQGPGEVYSCTASHVHSRDRLPAQRDPWRRGGGWDHRGVAIRGVNSAQHRVITTRWRSDTAQKQPRLSASSGGERDGCRR